MKKTFFAMTTVAVLLVLSSLSTAQETASAVPSEDTPIAETAQDIQADTQASVSDNLVGGDNVDIAAPIQPVEAPGAAVPQGRLGTSDCAGCGLATPMLKTSSCSNCGTCPSKCSGCCKIQTTNCLQPKSNCGCNPIGQVGYDQPIYQEAVNSAAPSRWVASPVSVVAGSSTIANPAYSPVPATVYASGQSGCACCASGYGPEKTFGRGFLTGYCNDCQPTRGRTRGRIFRNR